MGDVAHTRNAESGEPGDSVEYLRKRTEEAEAAIRELQAFSYSVAHDLRAPLRSIQGFGRVLMEEFGADLPPEAARYVGRMVGAAERMNTLISDLLTYSQISQADFTPEPVSLSTVIGDALNQIEGQRKECNGLIHVYHPLPQVEGHRAALAQTITNLLGNALKFVTPGVIPRAEIWAESGYSLTQTPTSAFVRLWVCDNGIGIAPAHHERIWGVFERLHGQEEYPGTGIGLAIVRKSVERMGGLVGVESELGSGSRFWVQLPRPALFGPQPLSLEPEAKP